MILVIGLIIFVAALVAGVAGVLGVDAAGSRSLAARWLLSRIPWGWRCEGDDGSRSENLPCASRRYGLHSICRHAWSRRHAASLIAPRTPAHGNRTLR